MLFQQEKFEQLQKLQHSGKTYIFSYDWSIISVIDRRKFDRDEVLVSQLFSAHRTSHFFILKVQTEN